MKFLKNILLSFSFILALHTNVLAHEDPFVILKNSADKAVLIANKKYKLLQINPKIDSIKFNPFLTIKKEKQSSAAQILNWDMKFKFRLSQNLNIIFSYN